MMKNTASIRDAIQVLVSLRRAMLKEVERCDMHNEPGGPPKEWIWKLDLAIGQLKERVGWFEP